MTGQKRHFSGILLIIFVINILFGSFSVIPHTPIHAVSARTMEFETNVTVPANSTTALDFEFLQGEEFELIFTFQVKEKLPIDVLFVNDDNYMLFLAGGQFLYYIDGSGQQLMQATKIVTVTQIDTYNLVFANYNNQSVEIYLSYDINIYPITPPEDTTAETNAQFWETPIFMLPLGLVIGILIGTLIGRISRKSKEKEAKLAKKDKNRKSEAKKKDAGEDTSSEDAEREKESEAEESAPEDAEESPAPSFCGHCGKPANTPFCPHCGKKVSG